MKDPFKVRDGAIHSDIAEVKVWTIFYDYFIFKPEAPDENDGYFHIVNLKNGNSTILVQDFIKDKDCKLYSLTNNECQSNTSPIMTASYSLPAAKRLSSLLSMIPSKVARSTQLSQSRMRYTLSGLMSILSTEFSSQT
jgi:hypothetical protein